MTMKVKTQAGKGRLRAPVFTQTAEREEGGSRERGGGCQIYEQRISSVTVYIDSTMHHSIHAHDHS